MWCTRCVRGSRPKHGSPTPAKDQSVEMRMPYWISFTASRVFSGVSRLSIPRASFLPKRPQAFPGGPSLSRGRESKEGVAGAILELGRNPIGGLNFHPSTCVDFMQRLASAELRSAVRPHYRGFPALCTGFQELRFRPDSGRAMNEPCRAILNPILFLHYFSLVRSSSFLVSLIEVH